MKLIARLLDALTRWAFPADSILIERLTTDRPLAPVIPLHDPVDAHYLTAAACLWPDDAALPMEA